MGGRHGRHGTPAELFTAVYEGDEDTVVRLLRAGADPGAPDEDGQTPLYLAAVQDEPGIVRRLLDAGAVPDLLSSGTDSPLCGAACAGYEEVVHALLAGGAAPDLVEEGGFTALAWAVPGGRAAVVEALLAAGADPDRPLPSGEAPLVAAARRGSPSSVRALLRYGAGARAEVRAEALSEARRLLATDVEAELRAGLERAYGTGHEVTVHRREEDGCVTVVVELCADGRLFAGDERQTGHAEIVTALEAL